MIFERPVACTIGIRQSRLQGAETFREVPVFWWFEQSGRYVRCEIRFAPEGYAFVVTGPDGVERVEEFNDSQELSKRQVALERELAGKGWTGPHGWNI